MSGDPSLEYGYARLSARLAARPDERLWRQLRSARSLQAAIDAVRGSAAAPYVAGVAARGRVDSIDLAFRQHLRARIHEVTAWAPQAWRAALRWTEVLVDLPVIAHLLGDARLPHWLRDDPHLAAYAIPDRIARRARLTQGQLAPLIAALPHHHEAPRRATASRRGGDRLHPLLRGWQAQWRQRWPRCSDEQRSALLLLGRTVQSHVTAFATLPAESSTASRERLADRLRRQLHDAAGQPAALFAYLLLVALDVERLRGEFALHATGLAFADAETAE
jgi:hypothetical protein